MTYEEAGELVRKTIATLENVGHGNMNVHELKAVFVAVWGAPTAGKPQGITLNTPDSGNE